MSYNDSNSRGSVISPVSAAAAAVSGEHNQTGSSSVPDLPGKLRGMVRRSSGCGRCLAIPFPYAGLVDTAPAVTSGQPASCDEVGGTPRRRVDVRDLRAVCLPSRISRRRRSHTGRGSPGIRRTWGRPRRASRTGTTLPGEDGRAIRGSARRDRCARRCHSAPSSATSLV